MKFRNPILASGLTVLAFSVTFLAASAPALGQSDTGIVLVAKDDSSSRENRTHERMQTHLQRMAEKLKINASQQEAWAAYTKTVQGLFATPPTRPAKDADAATILRARAALATSHGQKLTQLADATARLEKVLDPEQRKTLSNVVRREGQWRRHHGEPRKT